MTRMGLGSRWRPSPEQPFDPPQHPTRLFRKDPVPPSEVPLVGKANRQVILEDRIGQDFMVPTRLRTLRSLVADPEFLPHDEVGTPDLSLGDGGSCPKADSRSLKRALPPLDSRPLIPESP